MWTIFNYYYEKYDFILLDITIFLLRFFYYDLNI
jgi:hypothetical protein